MFFLHTSVRKLRKLNLVWLFIYFLATCWLIVIVSLGVRFVSTMGLFFSFRNFHLWMTFLHNRTGEAFRSTRWLCGSLAPRHSAQQRFNHLTMASLCAPSALLDHPHRRRRRASVPSRIKAAGLRQASAGFPAPRFSLALPLSFSWSWPWPTNGSRSCSNDRPASAMPAVPRARPRRRRRRLPRCRRWLGPCSSSWCGRCSSPGPRGSSSTRPSPCRPCSGSGSGSPGTPCSASPVRPRGAILLSSFSHPSEINAG